MTTQRGEDPGAEVPEDEAWFTRSAPLEQADDTPQPIPEGGADGPPAPGSTRAERRRAREAAEAAAARPFSGAFVESPSGTQWQRPPADAGSPPTPDGEPRGSGRFGGPGVSDLGRLPGAGPDAPGGSRGAVAGRGERVPGRPVSEDIGPAAASRSGEGGDRIPGHRAEAPAVDGILGHRSGEGGDGILGHRAGEGDGIRGYRSGGGGDGILGHRSGEGGDGIPGHRAGVPAVDGRGREPGGPGWHEAGAGARAGGSGGGAGEGVDGMPGGFDPGNTGTWRVRDMVPGADGGRRTTTILRYLLGLLAVDHVRALTRWVFVLPVLGLFLLLVHPRWIGLAVVVLGLALIAGRIVAVRLISRRTLPRRYRPVEDELRAAVEAGKANLRGELRRVGMPSSALALPRSVFRLGSSDSRSTARSRLRDIEIDRVLPRAQLDRALRVLDEAPAPR